MQVHSVTRNRLSASESTGVRLREGNKTLY